MEIRNLEKCKECNSLKVLHTKRKLCYRCITKLRNGEHICTKCGNLEVISNRERNICIKCIYKEHYKKYSREQVKQKLERHLIPLAIIEKFCNDAGFNDEIYNDALSLFNKQLYKRYNGHRIRLIAEAILIVIVDKYSGTCKIRQLLTRYNLNKKSYKLARKIKMQEGLKNNSCVRRCLIETCNTLGNEYYKSDEIKEKALDMVEKLEKTDNTYIINKFGTKMNIRVGSLIYYINNKYKISKKLTQTKIGDILDCTENAIRTNLKHINNEKETMEILNNI